MRKAYRSQVDQTLQPYRLYVPTKKPAGLVIALHGMGGNENSLFDGYGRTNALQRAAEQYGFLVACPKGRGPTSMYKGTAEQDVLDVLAEVQKDYAIDPKRIFLMGHSMGAFGTWSLAMAYPEKWAALGPISGGGDPTGMERIKDIPQYVVHGDNDRTVPVTLSRLMVNAAKKLDAKIEYHEIPGGTHNGVVAPHFAPLLAFFAGIPLNTVPH
jgi:predicted peptidase